MYSLFSLSLSQAEQLWHLEKKEHHKSPPNIFLSKTEDEGIAENMILIQVAIKPSKSI